MSSRIRRSVDEQIDKDVYEELLKIFLVSPEEEDNKLLADIDNHS
jgi:hypothetical protein